MSPAAQGDGDVLGADRLDGADAELRLVRQVGVHEHRQADAGDVQAVVDDAVAVLGQGVIIGEILFVDPGQRRRPVQEELHLRQGPGQQAQVLPLPRQVNFPRRSDDVHARLHQAAHDLKGLRVDAGKAEVPRVRADGGVQADRDVPVQGDAQPLGQPGHENARGRGRGVYLVLVGVQGVGAVVVHLQADGNLPVHLQARAGPPLVGAVQAQGGVKVLWVEARGLYDPLPPGQAAEPAGHVVGAGHNDTLAHGLQHMPGGQEGADGVPVRHDMRT